MAAMANAVQFTALSDELASELERVAREQERSPEQVLAEAIGLYLKQVREQRATPPERTRTDVQRLMEEFRRNQS